MRAARPPASGAGFRGRHGHPGGLAPAPQGGSGPDVLPPGSVPCSEPAQAPGRGAVAYRVWKSRQLSSCLMSGKQRCPRARDPTPPREEDGRWTRQAGSRLGAAQVHALTAGWHCGGLAGGPRETWWGTWSRWPGQGCVAAAALARRLERELCNPPRPHRPHRGKRAQGPAGGPWSSASLTFGPDSSPGRALPALSLPQGRAPATKVIPAGLTPGVSAGVGWGELALLLPPLSVRPAPPNPTAAPGAPCCTLGGRGEAEEGESRDKGRFTRCAASPRSLSLIAF